mgnify:CR=1 FL=1
MLKNIKEKKKENDVVDNKKENKNKTKATAPDSKTEKAGEKSVSAWKS